MDTITSPKLTQKDAGFLLQSLLRHTPDAIYFKDKHSRFTLVNHAAAKLFNLESPTDVVGKTDADIFTEEHAKQAFADEQEIIAGGKSVVNKEEKETWPDGTISWASTSKAPVQNENGEIIGTFGISHDITERKKAEAHLLLQVLALEAAANAIVITDSKGVIEWVNPAFTAYTGYSAAEAIGKNPRLLKSGKHDAKFYQNLWETISAGKVWHGEMINRRKDGTHYNEEMTITPIRDDRGNIKHFIAVHQDITERKQADAQIAEQASFLDEARDAILVRDLEGKILFWNKGAERIYGWTSQEAVGRNILEVFRTDPKKNEEINALTIKHGEWQGEVLHFTKDGSEVTSDVHCTLIRDDEGRPKSILSINTDITEKKKIEAQFMRAQRMESIGTLAGGVAHDLNNILAPIMMSIDVMESMTEDPQITEILKAIEISAKRGADIVKQVLSFARGMEGERIEIQPKHLLTDLKKIIKDTFPKDIRLKFSIPNDIRTIFGDPTQIHQILMNLSVNARDAMPYGGDLTIGVDNCEFDEHYVAMNPQAKAGPYVNISVADSGMGIPPELVSKIFEPFFTTKELNKGTGLGLSTVMAIVKSHEGMINVYSEPCKGTTFKIYLPAMDSCSELIRTQQMSSPRGNGETVLVVDDEHSILTITTRTLQAFGYQVLAAVDGAEAVAVYAEQKDKIAVVLTDMMMPLMDGGATIRALMRINPDVKIIAASGLNANVDVAQISGNVVKHFLTKPYTAGTLLKTLRAVLDGVECQQSSIPFL